MMNSNRGRYTGAAIVLVVLIVFFLNMEGYLGHRVEPGLQPLKPAADTGLVTASVVSETVDEFETAAGTLTSRKETVISSKIPAHIQAIHVKPGTLVTAGQLLIELDRRDIEARLAQAKNGLAAAQASNDQAVSAFERYRKLHESGAATDAEFESVQAQNQVAAARLNEARNAIREIDVMLDFAEIRAPYGGVIIEKLADVGTIASPGMPLIRMEDPEGLRLEVFVPESRRDVLVLGKTIMVRVETFETELPGQIDEIVPSADPRSRSYMVRIALKPDPALRSGMFGRCYLPTRTRAMTLVDADAVYQVGQLDMVRVVRDGRPETRLVRIGSTRGDKVEILSGLEPGETVILGRGQPS